MNSTAKDPSLTSDRTLTINSSLSIPPSEVVFRFSRSGGKGGQNVNKVETKVELLFDVAHSISLTDSQRNLLLRKLGSRLDADGILHIIAQASRSQWQNREDAVSKFVEVLAAALKPSKKRIKTKASRSSKEKRIQDKKKRGEIKKWRRGAAD